MKLAGACRNTSLTDMGTEWLAREELRAVRAVAAALPADSRRLGVVEAHQIVKRTDAWLKRRSAGAERMANHSIDGVHFRVLDMVHLRALMDVLALAVPNSPERVEPGPEAMQPRRHAQTRRSWIP